MSPADIGQMTVLENPIMASLGGALMHSAGMQMQLNFHSDNSCFLSVSMLGNNWSRRGTWQVQGWPGETAKVEIQFEGSQESRVWEIRFVDNNTFQTVPPEGPGVTVNRMVTFRRLDGH
jgi:hypothetical protein